MDNPEALAAVRAQYARADHRLGDDDQSRRVSRRCSTSDAIGIVMLDTGWVGGISEGHAIGKMAETYHRPFAPHDCTGPVDLHRRDAPVPGRCRTR